MNYTQEIKEQKDYIKTLEDAQTEAMKQEDYATAGEIQQQIEEEEDLLISLTKWSKQLGAQV